METFTKVVLDTGADGRARWRDEAVPLDQGNAQSMLSALMASSGCQLRRSPVGFRSAVHCSGNRQWVFILRGSMGIGLPGGNEREFGPGQHFFSADLLPEGASFDPQVHGHWSRQIGDEPLEALFVRG